MESDEGQLRVLVITSRPLIQTDGNPVLLLDVAEERRRITTALRQAKVAVQVHFLPEATTGAVQRALLEIWDIIHFTGHGMADGSLVLEDGNAGTQLLKKEEMVRLFATVRSVVVLSACYSETVGQALHDAGVPSVIAVDAETPIADQAAIVFAEHLYAALAHGQTVGQAFDSAQTAVALDPTVGDDHPPQKGAVWSERFRRIGPELFALPGQIASGTVTESGAKTRSWATCPVGTKTSSGASGKSPRWFVPTHKNPGSHCWGREDWARPS